MFAGLEEDLSSIQHSLTLLKQHFEGRKNLLVSWVGRTVCLGGSAGGLKTVTPGFG